MSDSLWYRLAAVWTAPQIIELLMLTGWYRAISYVCNVAQVPLEDWQARFPTKSGSGGYLPLTNAMRSAFERERG